MKVKDKFRERRFHYDSPIKIEIVIDVFIGQILAYLILNFKIEK